MKIAEALGVLRGEATCKLCALSETLEPGEREALDSLIGRARERPPGDRSPYGVGITTVVKVLQENGHPVGRVWVERHVKGACS